MVVAVVVAVVIGWLGGWVVGVVDKLGIVQSEGVILIKCCLKECC
jgi:hypothetical protein